jgi:hypothetical protein
MSTCGRLPGIGPTAAECPSPNRPRVIRVEDDDRFLADQFGKLELEKWRTRTLHSYTTHHCFCWVSADFL